MTSAILSSGSNSYIVDSMFGDESFGKVRKCIRMEDMKTVAIKIQKVQDSNISQMQGEVSSLFKLTELDPDKSNIVQFHETFLKSDQLYLVFEHLDKNLNDFINERQSKPLLLKEIRPIVCQLANAFNHLSSLELIHTDLNLDNVMLVNHIQEPYKVKLIDFGLAIDVSAAKAGTTVQPLAYRSPEILLGLPFTEAIDMWSLGILALNMYLGKHFYSSRTEYDTIRNIVETLGQPPDYMLCHGLNTLQYFKKFKKSDKVWRLKAPKDFEELPGIPLKVTNKRMVKSLDELLRIHLIDHKDYADKTAEMSDMVMFVDMLKRLLQLDPKKRITPRQLLYHPFISGFHLTTLQPLSPHVESCYDIMRAYQYYLDDDIADVLYGSLGETTLGPAQPVQSTRITNKSTPNNIASTKRKAIHDDGTMDETPHVSKRARSEWPGGGYTDPATARRSHDPTDHVQANASVRSHPTQHYSVNTTSHQQQADQHCIRTGIKRKITDDENDQIAKRFRQSDAWPHVDNPDDERKNALDDDPDDERKSALDDDPDDERKSALDDDPDDERKTKRRKLNQ